MKVSHERPEFKPVTVEFETPKEILAVLTALRICLDHWHEEEGCPSINSHIDIVRELHKKLSDNFN